VTFESLGDGKLDVSIDLSLSASRQLGQTMFVPKQSFAMVNDEDESEADFDQLAVFRQLTRCYQDLDIADVHRRLVGVIFSQPIVIV
jgi:hypothetical protein